VLKATTATAALLATGACARAAGGEQDDSGGARIDTHHHAVPVELQDWLIREEILPPDKDKWPSWARWDLASTLEVMDANGIEVGVASTPAPFDIFQTATQAAVGARMCNETLASLVRDHPRRFGFFAYLPLPHVDLALSEAAHAFDELGADGVLLMTHAGPRYLGDPAFDPVFEELNRRKAVVFTHPLDLPGGPAEGVPGEYGDFLLDTTRAAIRMIASGTLDRYPDLSIILSHAGGFLPYMASRFDSDEIINREQARAALRRFYFDTALPASPYAMPTLLGAADESRVLFGSDWNANSADVVSEIRIEFDRDPALDRQRRRKINRDNALRLLPTVAKRLAR
jgi:predicted TIM-barrel fold metal-dependent hydrolase